MSFPEVKIEAKGHTGMISHFSHLSSFLVFKHTKLFITSGTSQLMLPKSEMFSPFLVVWLWAQTVSLPREAFPDYHPSSDYLLSHHLVFFFKVLIPV